MENQPEWETRLAITIRPYDDEVCFQCWDGKIRTSPKRKLSKVEDDDPPLTTTTTSSSAPSPLSTTTTTASQLEEDTDPDDDPPSSSSAPSFSSSSSSFSSSSADPFRRPLTIEVPAPTEMEISLRKSTDSPSGGEKKDSPMRLESPQKIELIGKIDSPRKTEKIEKMDSPRRMEKIDREKMERMERIERVDSPRKPDSPRWKAEVSPRAQHKRVLVENYWDNSTTTTMTETTTSQIRQTQIEAHHSQSDYEGDSVFEEHEAVFLLSTAFKTFPSSPKMNSGAARQPDRRAPEG